MTSLKSYNILLTGLIFVLLSCGGQKNEENTTETEDSEEVQVFVSELWATDTIFKIPESVIYDEKRDQYFISNINGAPDEINGLGFITRMLSDGTIDELDWVGGLDAPKGMGIYEDHLWVTDINKVFELDINTAEPVNTYKIDSALFLNDIDIDPDGTIYISDSFANAIYTIENGTVSLFMKSEALGNPNGLFVKGDKLMLATFGTGELKEIDLVSKDIQMLADGFGGGDGLEYASDGSALISDWYGQLWYLDNKNNVYQLFDTKSDSVYSADIEFVESKSMILVPTFFDNRVVAYKLNK